MGNVCHTILMIVNGYMMQGHIGINAVTVVPEKILRNMNGMMGLSLTIQYSLQLRLKYTNVKYVE